MMKLKRLFIFSLLLIILALPMIAAYAQEAETAQPETIGSRGGSVFVLLIGAGAILVVGALAHVTTQRNKK
jgi:hypothetical protein